MRAQTHHIHKSRTLLPSEHRPPYTHPRAFKQRERGLPHELAHELGQEPDEDRAHSAGTAH